MRSTCADHLTGLKVVGDALVLDVRARFGDELKYQCYSFPGAETVRPRGLRWPAAPSAT